MIRNAKQLRSYGFECTEIKSIRKNGTVVYRYKIIHGLGKTFTGSWLKCLEWANKIVFGSN